MKKNLISKLLVLAALSLLLTGNIFAQRNRSKSGAVSTVKWETYQICDDSVSAKFPEAPTEQIMKEKFQDGSDFTMKTNSIYSNKSVYIVSCFEGLPNNAKEIPLNFQKTVFTNMVENYTKSMSENLELRDLPSRVRLLPIRASTLSGRAGFEQDFTIGLLQGKTKIVFFGTRGVWTVVMTVGATPMREKSTFFGALKINDLELAGLTGQDM